MNHKRIGRALICLILVCALLVNVSPIKAEAVAIESALGIGLAACLILASCGMIYTGLTQNEIIGVGNAFQAHMYQWGTSAEKLDEVDAFFGGLTLLQPPSGDDGDDDDDDWSDFRFTIPKALQRAIAGFTAGAILAGSLYVEDKSSPAPEGYVYCGDVLIPPLPSIDTDQLPHVYVWQVTNTLFYCYAFSKPINSISVGTSSTTFYSGGSAKYSWYSFDSSVDTDWVFVQSGTAKTTGTKYSVVSFAYSNNSLSDSSGHPLEIPNDFSSYQTSIVEPSVYVGDIPSGVQNGTITEENIEIPDTIDYSAIAAANPDLATGVMEYLDQVANGTVTYEDLKATIAPAVVPDPAPEPEPEPDPEPSEETFPAIVPDAGQDTVGNTNANTFLQEITDIVTAPFKWIWTNLDTKLDTLKPPEFDFDRLGSVVTEPARWIWGNIESYFAPLFDSTWTYIQAIPDKIGETAADLGAKLERLPDAIAQGATQVKTAVEEAAEKAVVPEKDYLTAKVRALQEEFVFADSIVKTGQALKKGLANISTEPPVIYIHLGDTEGSYNIGGTVPFLDLRWYARYKPTVDTLISAFLWICFVWRMLVKLPGIISGMPGDFVMASAHHMGVAEHVPSRSKEYEIQRISNREMIRKGLGK